MRRTLELQVALLLGLTAAGVVWSREPAGTQPSSDIPRQASETSGPIRLPITDGELIDVMLEQVQPPQEVEPSRRGPRPPAQPDAAARPAEVPRRPRAELSPQDLLARFAARRRRPLATVPHMFGDFFGSGGGETVITLPPITTVVTDGAYDLFVTNAGGTGANINPAVPITITNGPGGPIVSSSVGNGIDFSGDGQPDAYPISAPNAPGVLPPSVPFPVTLVYTGGSAAFADAQGNPADGSVGQGNGWSLIANYVANPNQLVINVPYGGGAIRRFKIAEHSSPQPRDRLFFDFNFYNDVIGNLGDVSRYTLGYERTIWDGSGSVELRVPFAATLASEQTVGGVEARDFELGNLAVWIKTVLYEVPTGLISAGLGAAVPTSSPSRVSMGEVPILEIQNDAVHLLPFLGAMSTPRERWFWQAFLQLDVAANGNRVRGDVTGQDLRQFGVLQDATLLFMDAAVGYSLFENACPHRITRIVPTAELHYSTTLQDTDVAAGNGFLIRSPTRRFDVLNLTLGASALWKDDVWIRPAMVLPLRDGDDEHFDYEVMVQVDWRL